MSTMSVPTIDLESTTPEELVDHLRRCACVIIGSGHGVSDDLWSSVIDTSRESRSRQGHGRGAVADERQA